MELAKEVYQLTSKISSSEKFGIIGQIRRAAISIPSNIAEGAGRNSNKEFIRFLGISQGSSYEAQTQLILLEELNFANKKDIRPLLFRLEEIQKMNRALQQSLQPKNH